MLIREGRPALAFRHTAALGERPTLLWLCGFNSDMQGTKVRALEAWAVSAGLGFLAFDYSGHGQSEGRFCDGTVSDWREDTLDVIDTLAAEPLVAVGSSMGGWMALLAASQRPGRLAGLVLVAPAPDFIDALMRPGLPPEAASAITRDGVWMQPSDHGEPVPISARLLASGAANRVLDRPVAFDGPVRILQGMADPDVPWRHAARVIGAVASEDVEFTLVKDGDHRLSRPQDIARLIDTCDRLVAGLG